VRIAATLVLGALAAWLCEVMRTPLPWMLGPLIATAAAGMAGVPVAAASSLRNGGQLVIGMALGLYFTPELLSLVARQAPAIAAGIVWALGLGFVFGAYLVRVNSGMPGLDRATVFFSSAIGGASEMAVLAERHHARVDLVAAAHSMRVLTVVIVIPFGLQWSGLHGLDSSLPGAQEVRLAGLALLVALA
jgi:hypothetical protein